MNVSVITLLRTHLTLLGLTVTLPGVLSPDLLIVPFLIDLEDHHGPPQHARGNSGAAGKWAACRSVLFTQPPQHLALNTRYLVLGLGLN